MPQPRKPGRDEVDREVVEVVLKFFEAFNNRDYDTMMDLIDEEHIDHTYFGKAAVSPEAVGRAIAGMFETFPDWHETVDQILPGPDGTVTVRQTGRGTQRKEYMGRQPTGKQVAETLVTVLKVKNGKITEYRSTFPFTTPFDEPITAGKDLQEVRAEQGGLQVNENEWNGVLANYAEGRISEAEVANRKAEAAEEQARCQSLLAANMRRCQNPALPGSLYCSIHQEEGGGGGFSPGRPD
jgi:predicted ester cyclase